MYVWGNLNLIKHVLLPLLCTGVSFGQQYNHTDIVSYICSASIVLALGQGS